MNNNPMPSLLDPFVKITLGKLGDKEGDIFQTGDGKLKSCSVYLGEGKNTSKCTFEIYDSDKSITDKYFTYIESVDGLDPLEPPAQPAGSSVEDNSFNSQSPVDDGQPGEVLFANTIASVYNPFEGGQNGSPAGGAYKNEVPSSDKLSNGNINWDTGYFAAMVDTKYKLGIMRVTNLANNKSTVVKIVDRGPFVEGRKIDLTKSPWNDICGPGQTYPPGGLLNVKIEWIKGATSTTPSNKKKEEAATDDNKEVKKEVAVTGTIEAGANNAKDSINKAVNPQLTPTPTGQTLAGSQITIELGFGGQTLVAYSFIHTSLRYSQASPHSLEFGGQAANWVLTQRTKNTVYTNMTFKKIAEKIVTSYGLKLEMEDEGPKYDYFPQRGRTDYDTLLIEARRLGYRVYTKGATLYIRSREQITASKDIFVQEYGFNLGETFEVTHTAQGDSSGGARSAEPNSNAGTTGERKFDIDANSGVIKQEIKEAVIGTGTTTQQTTTGSTTVTPTPAGTLSTEDTQRKSDEDRVKGITASTSFPTYPEVLLVDPDTPYRTKGLSTFLDRYWVVDSIEHKYELGTFITNLSVYSPLKNKRPTPVIDNSGGVTTGANVPVPSDLNAALYEAAIANKGRSSVNGPKSANGSNVACVWILNRIMESAGIPNPWGNSDAVIAADAALRGGTGISIPASQAAPGDIALWIGAGSRQHIGVVLTNGDIISNSSSNQSFTWVSKASFYEDYYNAATRYYRLK